MKKHLPFNILLAITVAVTGFMTIYNLYLRDNFAITVGYTLPQPALEALQNNEQSQSMQVTLPQQQEDYLYDDYFQEETQAVVTFPLELNKAPVSELMLIPQIGSVTAQRIVQYREELGGYTQLEQLMEIQGIGEKTYETISPYLYLEGQWFPQAENEKE